MKKMLSKKLALIPLSVFILMGSVFSVLITPSQVVYGASASECISKFDGKNGKTLGEQGTYNNNSTGNDLVNGDCTTYCSMAKDGKITCKEEDAAAKPLADLICKGSNSQNCRPKAIELYDKCKTGKVDESRTGMKDYGSPEACAKALWDGDEKLPSNAALRKAFSDGKVAAEEVAGGSKKQCEEEGKTWKDGECVAEEEGSSCKIDGIGWIVCPVLIFIGNIVDQVYIVVAGLLTVPPILASSSGTPLFNAWNMGRNFANVAFVIAFLIIVYSQITGMGLNNYGIKKLLPKIIVAAILVNVSYWICAIAVDISNIVGASIKGLFDGIISGLQKEDAYVVNAEPSAGAWVGATMVILAAGGALLLAGVTVLAPLAVAALIAVITVVVVLVARQAIIILLIVLAPLAFVAFLLPNTQKWFDRWKDSFLAMLLMFPMIGLLFGASQLASYVLASSAGGQVGTDGGNLDLKDINMAMIQLASLGVAVIPLVLAPFIVKISSGMLGQIAGFINNPNKGPLDKIRKSADSFHERGLNNRHAKRVERAQKILGSDGKFLGKKNSRLRRATALFASGGETMAVNAAEKNKYAKIAAEAADRSYSGERALTDQAHARRIASGNEELVPLIQAYGKQALREEDEKDTRAAISMQEDLSNKERMAILTNKNESKFAQAAAAAGIAQSGNGDNLADALDYLRKDGGGMTDESARVLALQQISKNNNAKMLGLGQGDREAIASGTYGTAKDGEEEGKTYNEKLDERIGKKDKISAKTIAEMAPHDVARIKAMSDNDNLSVASQQKIVNSYAEAKANPNLSGSIKNETHSAMEGITSKSAQSGIVPKDAGGAVATGSGGGISSGGGGVAMPKQTSAPATNSAQQAPAAGGNTSATLKQGSGPIEVKSVGGTTPTATPGSPPAAGSYPGELKISHDSINQIGQSVSGAINSQSDNIAKTTEKTINSSTANVQQAPKRNNSYSQDYRNSFDGQNKK